jgi:ATP-binding cassette subfamily B protein
MLIRIAVRSPAMMIFSLIMAFTINAKLALIFLAAVPVLAVGLWLIMIKAHPIFKRMFKRYDKLNRVVQENLRGVRVVKAFVREEEEINKFTEVSEEIKDDSIKAEKILAFNMPLMQISIYSCILLLSWLGASVIVNYNVLGIGDNMQTGDLAALLNYTMQILMALMSLSMIFVTIVMSRASAERVCEVLDEESTIQSPENGAVDSVNDGSIEIAAAGLHESIDHLLQLVHIDARLVIGVEQWEPHAPKSQYSLYILKNLHSVTSISILLFYYFLSFLSR